MTTDTIAQLGDPHGSSQDPLTDLLRAGARDLIQQAVEAELSVLLEAHSGDRTVDGFARLVRHGHLPEREVMTGIGAVPVKVLRVTCLRPNLLTRRAIAAAQRRAETSTCRCRCRRAGRTFSRLRTSTKGWRCK